MSEEEILTGDVLQKNIIIVPKLSLIFSLIAVFTLGAIFAITTMMIFLK